MTTVEDNEDFLKFLRSHQSSLTDEQKAALARAEEFGAAYRKQKIEEMVSQHGAVPPPWFFAENSHPGDIMWRMGGGEDYIRAFWEWWEQCQMDEAQSIAYFKKWPPPPRWMKWMANSIWHLKPWEDFDIDYAPYFAKLDAAGFKGVAEFEADFNDEKWLRREAGDEPA